MSLDGERIVLGDAFGALSVCDAATGGLLMTLRDSFVGARACAMSSDGRYIVTGSSARGGASGMARPATSYAGSSGVTLNWPRAR